MIDKRAGLIIAGALSVSLGLFGCGSPQSASTAESATESAAATESASAAESTSAAESASTADSTPVADSASTEEPTPEEVASSVESALVEQSETQSTTSAGQTSAQAEPQITQEEAIAIALADAGVQEADTTGLYATLDTDDGVVKYEVEFHVGTTEYEYDIDAMTGAILKGSSEMDLD